MAISFQSSAQAGTNSVTLPSGIVTGDLIVAYGYRNTTTAPTNPTGFTSAFTQSANGNSERLSYKFALGTESGTTLTFTNANVIKVAVYRGVWAVGGASSSTAAAGTSQTVTGIGSMQVTDGTSWAVSVFGSLQTTSATTPSGTTIRGTFQTGTTSSAMLVDSNGGVSSWSAHSTTLGASAAIASGSIELKAAPAASSFTDDFNDNSLDAAKWTASNSAGTSASETNQEIEIVTTTTNGYATVDAVKAYNMTGDGFYVNLVSAGNQALTALEVIFEVFSGVNLGANELFWLVSQGTISAYKKVNGTSTQLSSTTYNASTHAWLRIRESSGTTYWDYSSDGSSWNNLTSAANPVGVSSMYPCLTTGTYSDMASGTTIKFDSFNVTPATNVTVTPGVAALTTSTFAPTVLLPKVVIPSVLALSIAMFAPSVVTGTVVTPSMISLSITSLVPTVSTSDNKTVSSGVLSTTTTRYAPTISVSDNKTATPGATSLSITTYAPTVVNPVSVTIGVASLTLSTFAPVVSTPVVVTPDISTLSITTFAPDVSTPPPLFDASDAIAVKSFEDTIVIAGSSESITARSQEDTVVVKSQSDALVIKSDSANIASTTFTDSLAIRSVTDDIVVHS